ncbi:MAG: hypothetical protein DRN13_03460, partial [Thermoplasmata archaeon]
AKDEYGAESNWSDPLKINCPVSVDAPANGYGIDDIFGIEPSDESSSEESIDLPVVEPIGSEVTDDSVTLKAILVDDGGEPCYCYFEVWLDGSYYNDFFAGIHQSGETFTYTIYGLEPGNTYSWRAYAENTAGKVYSETKALPVSTSEEANNI